MSEENKILKGSAERSTEGPKQRRDSTEGPKKWLGSTEDSKGRLRRETKRKLVMNAVKRLRARKAKDSTQKSKVPEKYKSLLRLTKKK